jgi:hypothetical protein
MSLWWDCHEVEVTPNLEFWSLLVWVWREFVMSFTYIFTTSSYLIWRWPKIPSKKFPPNKVRKLWVLTEVDPWPKICPQVSNQIQTICIYYKKPVFLAPFYLVYTRIYIILHCLEILECTAPMTCGVIDGPKHPYRENIVTWIVLRVSKCVFLNAF